MRIQMTSAQKREESVGASSQKRGTPRCIALNFRQQQQQQKKGRRTTTPTRRPPPPPPFLILLPYDYTDTAQKHTTCGVSFCLRWAGNCIEIRSDGSKDTDASLYC